MDSILTSIKKLLGITEEYEHFDQDIFLFLLNLVLVLLMDSASKMTVLNGLNF